MKYSDRQRIEKMYHYAAKLLDYLEQESVDKQLLIENETTQWLVTTPLYNIGEQAYALSKDYKDAHPEVIWAMISGLRHRLVYDYDGTNWSIIADVVFDELPELTEKSRGYLEEE